MLSAYGVGVGFLVFSLLCGLAGGVYKVIPLIVLLGMSDCGMLRLRFWELLEIL